MQGLFKVKLNKLTLLEKTFKVKGKKNPMGFPFLTIAFTTPMISLPYHKRDEFGEWYRQASIKFNTGGGIIYSDDVSLQAGFEILGFGAYIVYQYGY